MGEIRLIRGSKEEGGKKKRERRNREEERKDLVLFKSIPRDWFVMTLKRKEKEYYFFSDQMDIHSGYLPSSKNGIRIIIDPSSVFPMPTTPSNGLGKQKLSVLDPFPKFLRPSALPI